MYLHPSHLVRLIVVLLALCVPRCVPANPVIGHFDSTRATTANPYSGIYSGDAVASLIANFPGISFADAPTLTPGFLAGVDVLLLTSADTGSVGIAPLSAAEQQALFDYVQAGGNAFLMADGYMPYIAAAQSMIMPFGMTIVDDGLSGVINATPTAPAHPVLDGPFGQMTSIPIFGAGVFSSLGPYAQSLATLDGNGLPILAAIDSGALGPGSGRVVIFGEVSVFTDDDLGGFFSVVEPLFLNSFVFLGVPEPSGLVLAAIAAMALGFTAFRAASRRLPRGDWPDTEVAGTTPEP